MAITEYGNSGLDHAAARKHGRNLTVFKNEQTGQRYPLATSTDSLGVLGTGTALYFRILGWLLLLLVPLTLIQLPALATFVDVAGKRDARMAAHFPNFFREVGSDEQEGLSLFFVKASLMGYSLAGKAHPMAIVWLHPLCALVMLVSAIKIRRLVLQSADRDEQLFTSAADYSVHLAGLPPSLLHPGDEAGGCAAARLRVWLEEYWGQVENLALGIATRDTCDRNRRFLKLSDKLAVAKLRQARRTNAENFNEHDVHHMQRAEELESQQAKCEQLRTARDSAESSLHEGSGHAIVTFRRATDAARCMNEVEPGRAWGAILGWCFAPRPRTFEGQSLQARRPPEPGDVLWENYEFRWIDHLQRATYGGTINWLCIGLSLLIIYGFELSKKNNRTNCDEELEQLLGWAPAGTGASDPSIRAKRSPSCSPNFMVSLTMLSSCIILMLDWALRFSIRRVSEYMRLHSKSAEEGSSVFRLSVAQFINTGVLIVIVYNDHRSWAKQGDLVDQVRRDPALCPT